ncbi:hypothetical protein [Acidovorax sp. NCPPB 3576]|uniref:hypothetical protein n=1 Tax=Acidovorax sp. NCPPB 3576 TaxID=2940488 RepID=UPI00234B124C|nr:hypothetical protein [Acidovorax sp. NCPPB 3576]WCM86981.1 hypothetical protein M5C98_16600 [Acidovorax sp. NCPPB 3576]
MPRGDKSAHTKKQKRQNEHIEDSNEHRGFSKPDSECRACGTVNKDDSGGKQFGGGRSQPTR